MVSLCPSHRALMSCGTGKFRIRLAKLSTQTSLKMTFNMQTWSTCIGQDVSGLWLWRVLNAKTITLPAQTPLENSPWRDCNYSAIVLSGSVVRCRRNEFIWIVDRMEDCLLNSHFVPAKVLPSKKLRPSAFIYSCNKSEFQCALPVSRVYCFLCVGWLWLYDS